MTATGRPEKPVDRTVPARAELADFLRRRKADANLTHEQIAELTKGSLSKATLCRATSGATVPRWSTVEAVIRVTITKEEEFADYIDVTRALELWIRARRATRAPYYIHKAPDPRLIWDVADLSRELRAQHVWAGYPTPGEMERMAGPGELPSSTTRRIIKGTTLPVDARQALAFLKSCYVVAADDQVLWLAAALRAFRNSVVSGVDYGAWTRAHDDLVTGIHGDHLFPPQRLVLQGAA
ncbi:helix-turn-helix domain-containing protein [Streptomyces sp. NPDC058316]|uniref:helix-turn-helix domain-containing protein n=1 Tax=Streptomyces sp. NPDC058316 TaxID=3346442 RepID=UPI0036E3CFD8